MKPFTAMRTDSIDDVFLIIILIDDSHLTWKLISLVIFFHEDLNIKLGDRFIFVHGAAG